MPNTSRLYTGPVNEALIELGFMLVILKLPVVYLCLVVWWAVRSEPPLEGASLPADTGRDPGASGRRPPRGPRPGPHGGPVRTYARHAERRRVTVGR
jgi:hypothetical protein